MPYKRGVYLPPKTMGSRGRAFGPIQSNPFRVWSLALSGSLLLTSLSEPPSHPLSCTLSPCSLFPVSLSTLSRGPSHTASHDTAQPGPACLPPRFFTDTFEICLALDRRRPIALPILNPLNFLTRSVAGPFEPQTCTLANLASTCTAHHPPLDKPSN